MEIVKQGVNYGLKNVKEGYQSIIFIEKEFKAKSLEDEVYLQLKGDEPYSEYIVNDGTTTEEVLEVLIDRLQYLNQKAPCKENSMSITKLEEALMWQNKRFHDKRKQQKPRTFKTR